MKAVTAVRGRIVALWRAMSLPYPEPGVRLIRQERIEQFDGKMQELLAEAVAALDRHYPKNSSHRLPLSGHFFRLAQRRA